MCGKGLGVMEIEWCPCPPLPTAKVVMALDGSRGKAVAGGRRGRNMCAAPSTSGTAGACHANSLSFDPVQRRESQLAGGGLSSPAPPGQTNGMQPFSCLGTRALPRKGGISSPPGVGSRPWQATKIGGKSGMCSFLSIHAAHSDLRDLPPRHLDVARFPQYHPR